MTLISVRLPEPELQALDSMAMEAQLSRSGLLRRALGEMLAGKLPPRPAPPGEAELLAVLGERARAGSAVAIKSCSVTSSVSVGRASDAARRRIHSASWILRSLVLRETQDMQHVQLVHMRLLHPY